MMHFSNQAYICLKQTQNINLKPTILKSEDIYNIMQQVMLCENNHHQQPDSLWVIGLNKKIKILYIEQLSRNADPSVIFGLAVDKLADRLILVHRAASGDLSPSQQDLDFTDKIIKVGRFLNVVVIDHLILSDSGFKSLSDEGIIEDLEKSGNFEVLDSAKPELTKWKTSMEQEKSRQSISSGNAFRKLKEGVINVFDYMLEGKKRFAELERIKIENERLKTAAEMDSVLKEEAKLKNQLLQHEINVKRAEHLKELGYSEERIQNMLERENFAAFNSLNVVTNRKSKLSSNE
ncbi:hypothetical protein KFE98_17555 [bacterium SCSIO 12741]|nr:hypothetical protein KFE98_17555 [bacterium SCSIO 12741]